MNDFPDKEEDFRGCWSSTAGELHGIKMAIVEIEKRAAEAFVQRRDEVANALRNAAMALFAERDNLSKRVNEYIAEDKRRHFEKTKILRR